MAHRPDQPGHLLPRPVPIWPHRLYHRPHAGLHRLHSHHLSRHPPFLQHRIYVRARVHAIFRLINDLHPLDADQEPFIIQAYVVWDSWVLDHAHSDGGVVCVGDGSDGDALLLLGAGEIQLGGWGYAVGKKRGEKVEVEAVFGGWGGGREIFRISQ